MMMAERGRTVQFCLVADRRSDVSFRSDTARSGTRQSGEDDRRNRSPTQDSFATFIPTDVTHVEWGDLYTSEVGVVHTS